MKAQAPPLCSWVLKEALPKLQRLLTKCIALKKLSVAFVPLRASFDFRRLRKRFAAACFKMLCTIPLLYRVLNACNEIAEI